MVNRLWNLRCRARSIAWTAVLCALSGAPVDSLNAQSASRADSTRLATQAKTQLADFIKLWRSAWMETESMRGRLEFPTVGSVPNRRTYAEEIEWERTFRAHCHADNRDEGYAASAPAKLLDRPWQDGRLSNGTAAAICPGWSPRFYATRADEDSSMDSGLHSSLRSGIAIARVSVIETLRRVAGRIPADSVVTRQLVRLLIDAGSIDEALEATRTCPVLSAWCAELNGLVAYRRGDFRSADSAFRAADAMRSSAAACAGPSLSLLLRVDARERFERQSCPERRTYESLIWWLATPLFASRANERLLEHLARQVLLGIHTEVQLDERFDLRAPYVTSIRQLILRYGWPSYFYWIGKGNDGSHESYLSQKASGMKPPYFSPEYRRDRIALVPDTRLITSPFTSTLAEWRVERVDERGDGAWWPLEHFRSRELRGNLDRLQSVVLRRQDSALIVVAAARAQTAPTFTSDDSTVGHLFATSGPTDVRSLATEATSDGVVRLHGSVGQQPLLISVELLTNERATARRVGFRSRFGTTPPEPLRTLAIGSVDVSQPTFVTEGFAERRTVASDWKREMLPTTDFSSSSRKVSIVWESYGVAAFDTATISLTVGRADGGSILQRLRGVVGMNVNPNGSLSMSWRETDAPTPISRVSDVPVQVRSISLDFGDLAPGSYWLEITMRGRTDSEARSRRTFRILP